MPLDEFWISRSFIRAGFIYLLAGIILGVLMSLRTFIKSYPIPYYGLVSIHTHLTLVGFVLFLIAGVGYHLFPVFFGTKLYSLKLGITHFFLANIALIGFSAGLASEVRLILPIFGSIQAVAWGIFIYNFLRTSLAKPPKTE